MSNTDPISSKETLVLPDALIGRKVGGYEIRGILGKGGMGVVYRAHDAALDREVALKLLPPALSADKEYAERFIREARMAAKLDHPRIVPVYAAGSSDAGAWIAMQLVKGRTLAEELHDGMRPTFGNVVKISKQAAEALGAAHKAGLIHRDIKPGNLIVDADGNVKVLDFGLARPTKSSGYTQDGTYLGTPEYSSPEQCQTSDIDGRADLYSLGCVMYEMLGGRIPHVAETPLALFTKIVNEDPIALRDLNPKVPPSLAAIVSRLLSKSRDSRYPDAAALVRDLDKVVVKGDAAAHHETVILGPADKARVAAWTLAGVLATLLVAAIVHSSPWSGRANGDGVVNTKASNTGATTAQQPELTKTPALINRRIVLLDFKNQSGDEKVRWLETALPELIASALATQEGLDPLEREDVTAGMKKEFNARLTSGGGDNVAPIQELQGVKLLAVLEAGVMIRGRFLATEKEISVTVTVLARDGEALDKLGVVSQRGSLEDVISIADRLATDVAATIASRGLRREALGDAPAAAQKALTAADKSESKLAPRRQAFAERLRSKREEKNEKAAAKSPAPGERDEEAGRKDERQHAGWKSEEKPDASPASNSGDGGKVQGDDKEKQGGTMAPPAADPAKGADDETLAKSRGKLKETGDALRALRELADEIREKEKELPEQELGAEGTAK